MDCPINCGEYNELRQCFQCKNITPYYIGVKENDSNSIICLKEAPVDYY